ncbi:mitochondrial carrier domain-containing protein [Pelagophyceae sp. CCMP2097]|nr:mitochondrial carrier domain-containing protein [Pelagophyceae sp. CCMP2097]|mmetsp:Transcript_10640/g.36815  ORF Transcript_10640/g.36815 Transcript_10640/m.36815 type:complete len:795 (+) Transcript_10640:38-2422(+)
MMRATLRAVLLGLLYIPAATLGPKPTRRASKTRAVASERPVVKRRPPVLDRRAAATGLASASLVAASAASARDLIWVRVADDVAQRPSFSFDVVERAYGLRFVEYLGRLLLEYDSLANNWWEQRRKAAALQPTNARKEAKRFEAYASFVSSVELDLARAYASGDTTADAARLFDALVLRVVPRTVAGQRQLAILAALSKTPLNTLTATFVQRGENRSVTTVAIEDRGSGFSASAPKVALASAEYLELMEDAVAPVLKATTRLSGKVLRIAVSAGGAGYVAVPKVSLVGGGNFTKAATARVTALDAEGRILTIVLDQPGAGYTEAPRVVVSDPGGADALIGGEVVESAVALLDYEIETVTVVSGGRGLFSSGKDELLAVEFEAPLNGGRRCVANALLSAPMVLSEEKIVEGSYRSSAAALTRLLPATTTPMFDARQRRWVVPQLADADVSGSFDDVFGPRSDKPVTIAATVSKTEFFELALAGAVCTAAAHVVLTPFEVVKTKIQTTPTAPGVADLSPLVVLGEIVEDEGAAGLFAGADAIVVGYFISGFFGFGLTEFFKRQIEWPASLDDWAWSSTILASLGASIFATAAVVPFETAKVRKMTADDARPGDGPGSAEQRRNESVLAAWAALITERGGVAQGLFGRAIVPLLVKDVIFAVFKFGVFDYGRTLLAITFPEAGDLAVSLTAGAVAGALASVASHPVDTAFAQIETSPPGAQTALPRVLADILDRGGPAGLYRGAATRAIFCGCLIALEFAIFEALRNALHISRDDFVFALEALPSATGILTQAPNVL